MQPTTTTRPDTLSSLDHITASRVYAIAAAIELDRAREHLAANRSALAKLAEVLP